MGDLSAISRRVFLVYFPVVGKLTDMVLGEFVAIGVILTGDTGDMSPAIFMIDRLVPTKPDAEVLYQPRSNIHLCSQHNFCIAYSVYERTII